jgi:uncharacterized Zn finger protein
LDRKRSEAYCEAIGRFRKVRALLIRLGQPSDFDAELPALRLAHKSKRNFMRLLDHAQW